MTDTTTAHRLKHRSRDDDYTVVRGPTPITRDHFAEMTDEYVSPMVTAFGGPSIRLYAVARVDGIAYDDDRETQAAHILYLSEGAQYAAMKREYVVEDEWDGVPRVWEVRRDDAHPADENTREHAGSLLYHSEVP